MATDCAFSSAASSKSDIYLWVRPEAFYFTVLPASPHLKLALKFLKRIIPYAQTKGQLGYPKLSYSVWKHIACSKLQLSETSAWMFFSTYRTLHRGRQDTKIQWDSHYAKRTSTQERDYLKSLTTVDTLRFVLMLFMQHYNKITLRSSSVSSLSSEEWPSLDKTSDILNKSSTRRSLKVLDEPSHLAFVERKLVEIFDLIDEGDNMESSSTGNERTISLDALEALSFIIEGSVDGKKSVLPLHEILMLPQVRDQLVGSSSRSPFGYHATIAWILQKLVLYPYGVTSCLSATRQPLFKRSDCLENSYTKSGSMMANTSSGPKGHRYLVLSRFSNQTLAKSSVSLKSVNVRIHRCYNSFIYLLLPLRSVVITKCQDTTIVLGPTAMTVSVNACKGLRIMSICRRLTISDCQNCSFHLLTPTSPLLVGNRNRDVILAPFNTTYPKLEEQMNETGIGHALNLWDSPTCLSDDGNIESQTSWSVMSRNDFYIFNIPFEMEGTRREIPGNPGSDYQNALLEKKKQVEDWHHLVKSAHLSTEQRGQLNKLVRERFQNWLVQKGYQRELDGLASFSSSSGSRYSKRNVNSVSDV